MRRVLMLTSALALLAACGGADTEAEAQQAPSAQSEAPAAQTPARGAEPTTPADALAMVPELPPLDEELLSDTIATLASDEFEGRAPATEGGMKTRRFLAKAFEDAGLQPVNGSYEQAVPMVELTLDPAQSSFTLTLPDGTERALSYGDEAVWWTKQVKENVSFDGSDVVFVGYGVVAPEYGWNDYEGMDVEGKTVVILVNDPGYALEGEDFKGREMTYYGRWTYKYEEAARQGAAAAIIVHQTAPAAYGWNVVEGSWTGPQLDLERPDDGASRAMAEGWVQEDVAREMFDAAGLDFEAQLEAAQSKDFTPVEMGGMTAAATLKNGIKRSESANVVGVLPGAEAPEEYVLYMAHWDHLGVGDGPAGEDHIFNGAVDNATGTAGLVTLAESFAEAEDAPRRSIMFLAVTGEESGLLGSAYYGEDPLVPFERTVGGINMDAIAPTAPSRDLIVVGYGASEVEDVLKSVADREGKALRPDASPEKGYFYRSDHISLAKKGVPMIYVDKGIDLVEGGEEAGRAAEEDYTANRYHQPSDQYDPETWRLDGLTETLTILRDTGAALAYSDAAPNWYEGNEFRALRDRQIGGD
ncbi:M28 family metallopeptidase [Parvularcula dongshanensis]|uniref:Zn-dependent M28 family amino/carboxypeptidase n=1 Tax=Parvularcula dongshanensis TaxID=1173995 RepID=A0A840I0Y1_9PROT|nr:M28 family metallopeptidase [Parvularcula dongshanensis]MBB4658716.1 Zn-dependent M28 family amino/carboxypeptidase [Parvularcula dongshanensis]